MKKILFFLVLGLLASCSGNKKQNEENKIVSSNDTLKSDTVKTSSAIANYVDSIELRPEGFSYEAYGENYQPHACKDTAGLVDASQAVIRSIKSRNIEKIADFVHPTKGVRFSPSITISIKEDLKMTAQQLKDNWANTKKKLTWGFIIEDEKLQLTMKEYFDQKVYDRDYATLAKPMINIPIDGGNIYSNVEEIYPDADFTEYYIPGTEKEGGLDWRSLGLVFEKYQDKYYLVGINHSEWTP